MASSLLADLLDWWTLNESSGSRADSVGGLTLSQSSTVAGASGFGDVGNVSVWDANGYLSGASAPLTESPWTVAGWFKPGVRPFVTHSIFCNGRVGVQDSQLLMIHANGKLRIKVDGGGIAGLGTQELTVGTWYHVSSTYDGAVARVYLNGSATPDIELTQDAVYTSVNICVFGQDALLASSLKGSMVAWGVWSRVLTGSEISELYNGGSGIQYPFESEPAPADTGYGRPSATSIFVPSVIKNAVPNRGLTKRTKPEGKEGRPPADELTKVVEQAKNFVPTSDPYASYEGD